MGLLSNPSLSQRNKYGRTLAKFMRTICVLFYIAGNVWFVCLAHPDFNHSTYLSENALSPGLVYPEVKQESSRLAHNFLEELNRERETHKLSTPYAWILAKMKQIGLETHVHNFTLNYPFDGGKVFPGKNIYGIIRASRIGSTEGIVFSVPYRAPNSINTDITAGVPLLLAFADFARKRNYWAKDLIFLITEREQLGMYAWLEAYHNGGITTDDSYALDSGNLPARAGALQAAVNLEIQDLDFDYIDVKLEGLNGQLPNLDMFNLVQRITAREGIKSGYKQKPRKKRRSSHNAFEDNLKNMVTMISSQASGVPNGNHGLFHRYRVESLTLEAIKHTTYSHNNNRLALLKTLEGIARSLNNLLERFHQSYFFYILVQNDRFISIGDFMPCLVLMASALFIKSFLLWLSLDNGDSDEIIAIDDVSEEVTHDTATEYKITTNSVLELPYRKVLIFIGLSLFVGLLGHFLPMNQKSSFLLAEIGITTAPAVYIMMACVALLGCVLPFLMKLPNGGLELLHIGTMILFGTVLIVLGLLNFALGFIVAQISVPLAIYVQTDKVNTFLRLWMNMYVLLLNPLVVIHLIVWILTLYEFPEVTLIEVTFKSIMATMEAVTFGLMDSIFYGNWLYSLITLVFFPIWILLWTLSLSRCQVNAEVAKEKIN